MNHHDPFEERARRQPLRAVPPEWREEILDAALAATSPRRTAPRRERGLLAGLQAGLRELLWPAPRAWAGLASLWLLIVGINFALREPAPQHLANRLVLEPPLMRELLREQHQMLAELVGPPASRAATRPKPLAPQPRSQRREAFFNA